jgi:glycosyltransferase involved in cell wall biosynthesis
MQNGMNIGFDAKRAFQNTTGLGQYSRTLIASLATYFPDDEYFLFAPKNTSLFDTSNLPNVYTVTPTSIIPGLFKSLWRSSLVKKDLLQLGINLYHGLSHEIPVGIHKTGIRSVVTIHDLIHERYPKQYKAIDVAIYRKKFQYACQYANRVIAISEQTKKDIIDFYKIPAGKIDVCYQSCNPAFAQVLTDEEKQAIREKYQLPEQFFLYVGSIIERKNLLGICKALQQARNRISIPLVVIGQGGKYQQQVKEYIRENNLQQQVIFLADAAVTQSMPSYRFAADFPGIYQNALALVYPSFFEGFGIPVLEALWSNLPVITSSVSCMPETGGDAAYYIDPASTTEMADALHTIATDGALRQSMIAKGRKHAERFSVQSCAESVMQVYKKMMK